MKLLGEIIGNFLIFVYKVVLIIIIGIAIVGGIMGYNMDLAVKNKFSDEEKTTILSEIGIVNTAGITVIETKAAYERYYIELTAEKDIVSFFTENMGLEFSETGLVSFCEDMGLYKSSVVYDDGEKKVGYNMDYDKLKKYVEDGGVNYFDEMTVYVEDRGIEIDIYTEIASRECIYAMRSGAKPSGKFIKEVFWAVGIIILLKIPLVIIERKRYKRELEEELAEEEQDEILEKDI